MTEILIFQSFNCCVFWGWRVHFFPEQWCPWEIHKKSHRACKEIFVCKEKIKENKANLTPLRQKPQLVQSKKGKEFSSTARRGVREGSPHPFDSPAGVGALQRRRVSLQSEQPKVTLSGVSTGRLLSPVRGMSGAAAGESQSGWGWQRPLKAIESISLPWAGDLQRDQVAQSPIQPDLEHFQGWDIHHLSGQPVPGFHHPQQINIFSYPVWIFPLLV